MIARVRPPADSVHPKTRAEWRRWLAVHHARKEGVWLVAYKASSGKARMSYDDAVEEALCWGWIDSRTRALDDERGMTWMSPRKPRSGWSRSNKERVARLVAKGSMKPAGLACVEIAKANGSWSSLDAVEAMEVPDDLARALKAHRSAKQFAKFPPSGRRAILHWIHSARKPETRAKRIEETARLAAMDIQPPQWRKG